jgi:UDP-2,3-diacylglucosamine hydrolase
MDALFISDLHLSPERPDITGAFVSFLETKAVKAKRFYILGDLFEAWIGDDDPSELARTVVNALNDLSQTETQVFVQQGNRDFLLGKRFARETGTSLLPDYEVIASGDKQFLLCHGDTLCLEDVDYIKFRRKVRNPIYSWVLAHMPLKFRQNLAANWRAKSMAANSNKSSNIMDATPSEVDRLLAHYNCSVMIHGHTHRPKIHPTSNGQRYVLGDWDKQGWYISLDKGETELVSFDI